MTAGTIDVLVYAQNGSTLLAGPLPDVLAVSWLDELEGVGGGSLTVAWDNPALLAYPTLLASGNVVKVRVNGTIRGAFWIKKPSEVVVGSGAGATRAITVSGPGLLSWLRDSITYQEFPTAYGKGTRHFGWASKVGDWYNPALWGLPQRLRSRSTVDLNDPANRWRSAPVNWPNTSSWWVWGTSGADAGAPVGDCYFRLTFTAAALTNYQLYLTADNVVQVQVDGESICQVSERDSWKRSYQTSFTVGPGDHVVGFRARNLGSAAGLLAALYQVTVADDKDVYTLVAETGGAGTWRVLPYPSAEPGWTVGEVLFKLHGEAVARGVDSAGWLTPGFGVGLDSEGVPWKRYAAKVDVGQDLLKVCEQLTDLELDVTVNPETLTWHAYADRGTDRSRTVIIDASAHISDLTEDEEADLATALLIATGEQWAGAKATGATRRIERYVDLSRFTSAQAVVVAQAILDRAKIPAEGVEVTYVPTLGNTPWTDFAPGDRVSVSTALGGYVSRVVVGISVAAEKATGAPVWTVELDSVNRDMIERLERVINQAGLVAGSAAGVVPPTNTGDGGSGGGWDSGNDWGDLPGGGLPDDEWPGGGDDFWSPDDYLGLDGGGIPGAGPVLDPPLGIPPWLPPTDPGGGSGTLEPGPDDPAGGGGVDPFAPQAPLGGSGRVALGLGTWMVDRYAAQGDLLVHLLTDLPPDWTGLGSVELSGTGYVPEELTVLNITGASGVAPVSRRNGAALMFSNTGATDWDPVLAVAITADLGTTLLGVIPLPTPFVVAPDKPLVVPELGLSLEVTTIGDVEGPP